MEQEVQKKRKVEAAAALAGDGGAAASAEVGAEAAPAQVPASPELSKEELTRLLEPFTREQLVDILTDTALQYADVAESIYSVASKDPAHRKLFVRGLAWETTTQNLRDAFAQYGEVDEGAVITDKASGKSRGFGFITFKSMASAYRALREPSKKIDGRMTVCNLAAAGSTSTAAPTTDATLRKLYVGGLSYDTSSETLLNIFSQYGEIEEGAVAYDKVSNKSRGFAFVTFKSVDGAKRAVADGNKTIDGRQVVVKIAAEGQRERAAQQAAGNQQQVVQAQEVPQQSMQQQFGTAFAMNQALGGGAAYRPQLAQASQLQMAYASPTGMTYASPAAMATYALPGQYGNLAQYVPAGQMAAQFASGQQQSLAQFAGQGYTPGSIAGLGLGNSNGNSAGGMPMYFTSK